LLWHGIWAFKAKGKGEETDLIMGKPIDTKNLGDIGKSAEALVLTEWKRAKAGEDIHEKIDQWVTQAKSYSRGNLGGIALEDYRYIVLVTEKYIKLPPPRVEDGVEFRFVNIAVDPGWPSDLHNGL
jgi:hypothetical protein